MEKRLEAVYENGVLRPLEPLTLKENQRVSLTIADDSSPYLDVESYLSPEEWDDALHRPVGVRETRAAMSVMPGSLSDSVIELRRDR